MTNKKTHIDLNSLEESYVDLKNRERKLREIINMLPETIFEADLEGKGTFVNDAGLALFGYSRDDFMKGIEIKKMFCYYERERIETNYKKVLEGERNQSTEYMALRKDGTAFPVLIHSRPILHENRPVGICGVLIDMTENYKIRKQLEREKNFVDSLLDTANSLIVCLDVNEEIIVFNKECEKLTGYTFEEVRGKNWQETFIPAEFRRKSIPPFSQWIKEHPHDRYEGPLMIKSGKIKMILWSSTIFSPPDSDEVVAVNIGHDVTQQIKAVKALQDSERHYRAVWDNLPVGICLTDRNGVYQYVNPAYCKIYGYEKEDFLGKTPDGLIVPATDFKARKKRYNERFDRQIPTPLSEREFYKSDGSPVWVEVSSDFIRENDKAKLLISINIDITKRKAAEAALKESEQRYSLLFQNVNESIVILNKKGVFEMMNIAAARNLGGKPKDFIGKKIEDVFPPEVAKRQMAYTTDVIKKSKQKTIFQDYTFPNNEKKCFRVTLYPVKDKNNVTTSALLISRETTEDVRKEKIINARFKLFDDLRNARCVDDCLELGCRAIFEAGLFRRSALTLHNEKREITNLGHAGLDNEQVEGARNAKAPSQELSKKMTRRKFRISNSYFIPAEAALSYKTTKRYIPENTNYASAAGSWQCYDELFVPVLGSGNKIDGWLSVDTPFNGKRPSYETIRLLEEITGIVTQRAREISNQKILAKEQKLLAEKNVAMKEILDHIEEEKAGFKQRIADNIDRTLLPVLNRMIDNPGNISESSLIFLKNGLKDLGAASGGVAQLYSKLSNREIEICNLIKMDWTSKEIANTLKLSVATVHKHRETIRSKLGLTNKEINLQSYIKNL
ncbi:MAG: PAS domain S-box protein [Candidatus Zixiibacteriota bacterium]|nr:MAG: PAS domain S-box protein [candidate division Zixibacteria bacterium]